MSIKSYDKFIDPSNRALTQTQDSAATAIRQISLSKIINGNLLTGMTIAAATASPSVISHGLGSRFLGFIVVRGTTSAVVYESTVVNRNEDKFIHLNNSSTASVTVDLWVF